MIVDGIRCECFGKGEYVIADSGDKYIFLDSTSVRTKDQCAVYNVKAWDEDKKRVCFLKFAYYDTDGKTNWVINNLKRESQFRFSYPYIEHVYGGFSGSDPNGNRVYSVIVEYVDGENLEKYWIKQRKLVDNGQLEESEFEIKIFRNIMEFLYGVNHYMNYAEEPYLHRDLKPENIMISKDGRVIIVDFDYAHISESSKTRELRSWGLGLSRGYTDPKTVNDFEYNKMTDIYSMGRIFFFWLNGYGYFEDKYLRGNKYCKDLAIGYGSDKSRFQEKYWDSKYERLLEIIKYMCIDPETGKRYTEVGSIIRDMEKFLAEYYSNFGKKYEEVLRLDEMPLLKRNYSPKCRLMVTYKVLLPHQRKIGHILEEYTMRDIKIEKELIMTIYIINERVYFIPCLNTNQLLRERKGEDFEIHSYDIFDTGSFKIQFYITA